MPSRTSALACRLTSARALSVPCNSLTALRAAFYEAALSLSARSYPAPATRLSRGRLLEHDHARAASKGAAFSLLEDEPRGGRAAAVATHPAPSRVAAPTQKRRPRGKVTVPEAS